MTPASQKNRTNFANQSAGKAGNGREEAGSSVARSTAKGQALVLIALVMTLLILFVGLGVDTGNLMGRRAKWQSAVDTAALSAAQELGGTITSTAVTKAYQMLEANGIASNTLTLRQVDFPRTGQVHVKAI